MLQRIDGISADIATVQARIEAQLGELAPSAARLDAIPGVGPIAAQMILAEIGTNMSRFPTPAHLTSWARFAPGVTESAGRKKGNAGTGNGNRYLARVVGEAAASPGGAGSRSLLLDCKRQFPSRWRCGREHRLPTLSWLTPTGTVRSAAGRPDGGTSCVASRLTNEIAGKLTSGDSSDVCQLRVAEEASDDLR